jgi:iron complex transport system ATP-binding protein
MAKSESTPLIELDHVSYRQGDVEILCDVSWRLDRARHWAVLGPNGSGKTTLLRIACGYLWPTCGVVRRRGEELVDLGELRRSIGWVATDLAANIPPRERAIETVVSGKFAQIGLKRLGEMQPTEADFVAARRLLGEMQCEGLADKRFRVLSQGERQQVLVARARMVDPLLIVLDEPCAGMDPGVRERFLAWLNGVASRANSCAMILVTHHVEEIMPAFESTLVMRDGRLAAAGRTAEIVTAELLEDVYGVNVTELLKADNRLWPLWTSATST